MKEAEAAAAEAHARMAQGEARAAAAEAAKIELSLKLADALSQQDLETDISAVPTPVTPRLATSPCTVCAPFCSHEFISHARVRILGVLQVC